MLDFLAKQLDVVIPDEVNDRFNFLELGFRERWNVVYRVKSHFVANYEQWLNSVFEFDSRAVCQSSITRNLSEMPKNFPNFVSNGQDSCSSRQPTDVGGMRYCERTEKDGPTSNHPINAGPPEETIRLLGYSSFRSCTKRVPGLSSSKKDRIRAMKYNYKAEKLCIPDLEEKSRRIHIESLNMILKLNSDDKGEYSQIFNNLKKPEWNREFLKEIRSEFQPYMDAVNGISRQDSTNKATMKKDEAHNKSQTDAKPKKHGLVGSTKLESYDERLNEKTCKEIHQQKLSTDKAKTESEIKPLAGQSKSINQTEKTLTSPVKSKTQQKLSTDKAETESELRPLAGPSKSINQTEKILSSPVKSKTQQNLSVVKAETESELKPLAGPSKSINQTEKTLSNPSNQHLVPEGKSRVIKLSEHTDSKLRSSQLKKCQKQRATIEKLNMATSPGKNVEQDKRLGNCLKQQKPQKLKFSVPVPNNVKIIPWNEKIRNDPYAQRNAKMQVQLRNNAYERNMFGNYPF